MSDYIDIRRNEVVWYSDDHRYAVAMNYTTGWAILRRYLYAANRSWKPTGASLFFYTEGHTIAGIRHAARSWAEEESLRERPKS